MEKFKSGFVALVGRTNVGKSTLLNAMLNQKLMITTNKPQTTRNTIRGIYNSEHSQIVFLDTPGIHKPKNKLGDFMIKSATDTLSEVDLVLFLVDDAQKIGKGDRFILDMLEKVNVPVYVIVNKIDTMNQQLVENAISLYEGFEFVDKVIPVSAREGAYVPELLKKIEEAMPEGVAYFPNDVVSDQAEKFFVGEIIREKLLMYLEDEVPHGVAVTVDSFKERKNKELIDIVATVICERESHKGIIIGERGRKLKGIGSAARTDIQRFLGTQVNLQLWVKVKSNWRDNSNLIEDYGYRQ